MLRRTIAPVAENSLKLGRCSLSSFDTQKEKLRNHERRAEMVRQNKAALADQDTTKTDDSALPVDNETTSSG